MSKDDITNVAKFFQGFFMNSSSYALVKNIVLKWLQLSSLMNCFNVCSSYPFVSLCCCKCHTWIIFFSHELITHVSSCHPFETSCSHKYHIQMVCFSHEPIQDVSSCDLFANSCTHCSLVNIYFSPSVRVLKTNFFGKKSTVVKCL